MKLLLVPTSKFEDNFEPKDILAHIFGPDISKTGYKDENKKYICPECKSGDIKVYEDLSGYCNACNESFMKGNESI